MLNKVILMGRLCADPEIRQTPSGVPLCRIRVAVDRPVRKDQERQADFINVTCWRQTAEFVSRYFSKGKMIIVEGKLQNNDYTDNNGVKHYSMVVVADNVQFGESKNSGNPQGGFSQQNNDFRQGNGYPQQNRNAGQNNGYNPEPARQEMQSDGLPPFEEGLGSADDFRDIFSDGEVPF